MAINRYDTPARDNYQSAYVPLPYKELMGTVAARQAQVDQMQEMLDKTYADTKNIKYIPKTVDEQYVKDYIGKSGELVQKYMSADISDPIVKRQMMSDFNSITDRTRLQDIQTNANLWQENIKNKATLKANGLYNPLLDEDPANNPNFNSQTDRYDYQTRAFKPHRPVAEQFFNNLDDSIFRNAKGEIDYTKEGYLLQGRNKSMTDRLINTKWTDFDNTTEGHDAVTVAIKQKGGDPNDPKLRQGVAKELLQEVAPEFWHETIAGSRAPKGSGSGSDTVEVPEYNNLVKSLMGAKGEYSGEPSYKKAEKMIGETSANLNSMYTNLMNFKEGKQSSIKNQQEYDAGMAEYETEAVKLKKNQDRVNQAERAVGDTFDVPVKSAMSQYYSEMKKLGKSPEEAKILLTKVLASRSQQMQLGGIEAFNWLPETFAKGLLLTPKLVAKTVKAVGKYSNYENVRRSLGEAVESDTPLRTFFESYSKDDPELTPVASAVDKLLTLSTKSIEGNVHMFGPPESGAIAKVINTVGNVQEDFQKAKDVEYKKISGEAISESYYQSPTISRDLNDGNYYVYVNGKNKEIASGVGEFFKDLGLNPTAYKTELVESTSDKRRTQRKDFKKTDWNAEIRQAAANGELDLVGTRTKRNADNSLSVFVVPKVPIKAPSGGTDKRPIGTLKITIPAVAESRIQNVIKDLSLRQPVVSVGITDPTTNTVTPLVIPNPQIERLKHPTLEQQFNRVSSLKDEFEVPLGNVTLKVKKDPNGLWHLYGNKNEERVTPTRDKDPIIDELYKLWIVNAQLNK